MHQFYGTPIGNDIQHANKRFGGEQKLKKRLHGAWTGGHSAGFFNTVGSKEGFTPSSFVLSGKDKTKSTRQQRLEDFMDEEDRADYENTIELKLNEAFEEADALVNLLNGGATGFGYDILRKQGWSESRQQTEASISSAAPENTHGEGLGHITQSFAKRRPKKRLPIYGDDDADDGDTGTYGNEESFLPKLLPKKRVGSKHRFVGQKKMHQLNPGTPNVKCRDGVYTLPGFVLMNDRLLPLVRFTRLSVPSDFQPRALRRKRKFEDPEPESEKLDTNSRTRQRNSEVTTAGFAASGSKTPKIENSTHGVDKDTAQQALQNTTDPYPDDPIKSQRYKDFLESCIDGNHHSPGLDNLEKSEFARVAKMFKPLSGAMANRFSGGGGGTGNATKASLESPKFGTRIETEFIPEKLLSKRFNIPAYVAPHTEQQPSGQAAKPFEQPHAAQASAAPLSHIDTDRNEALESEKAPMEMFQLIFGTSQNKSEPEERL